MAGNRHKKFALLSNIPTSITVAIDALPRLNREPLPRGLDANLCMSSWQGNRASVLAKMKLFLPPAVLGLRRGSARCSKIAQQVY